MLVSLVTLVLSLAVTLPLLRNGLSVASSADQPGPPSVAATRGPPAFTR